MRKLVICIIFCIIVIALIIIINKVLLPKAENNYYILERDYKERKNEFDILVFGSCHAYTSFNPIYLEKEHNISSYVLANPGEILPTTYIRMKEQFEKYTPKYVIVETWGINAYETYDTTERILGNYLKNNLECLPLSFAKLEVINDFDLDVLELNFPIFRYKDRLLDNSLTEIDFNYSSEKVPNEEMLIRIANNGFKVTTSYDVTEELAKQPYIEDNVSLQIETIIVKYLDRIIKLCKEYGVELIFYRSPYLSKENELKKLNHFQEICNTYNIPFINLEKEINYDYTKDFSDRYHLSELGANKSTEYIAKYILNKNK